jgi:hypothetical protein
MHMFLQLTQLCNFNLSTKLLHMMFHFLLYGENLQLKLSQLTFISLLEINFIGGSKLRHLQQGNISVLLNVNVNGQVCYFLRANQRSSH